MNISLTTQGVDAILRWQVVIGDGREPMFWLMT
jgi:hypothetical protein